MHIYSTLLAAPAAAVHSCSVCWQHQQLNCTAPANCLTAIPAAAAAAAAAGVQRFAVVVVVALRLLLLCLPVVSCWSKLFGVLHPR
jgi:hypothetical protein